MIGPHGFETFDGTNDGIHDRAVVMAGDFVANIVVMCEGEDDKPHITIDVAGLDIALLVETDLRSLDGIRRWGRMLIAAADIAEHGNRPAGEGSA